MLKHIPSILSPELMKVLMEMGHGDEIVLSDGNFPAASCALRLIRSDGHGIPELLDAVMKFLPLDYAVDEPVALMATPANVAKPEIWESYRTIIDRYERETRVFGYLERFAFYERAKNAYAVVATGETTRFANIILKKGIVLWDEVSFI